MLVLGQAVRQPVHPGVSDEVDGSQVEILPASLLVVGEFEIEFLLIIHQTLKQLDLHLLVGVANVVVDGAGRGGVLKTAPAPPTTAKTTTAPSTTSASSAVVVLQDTSCIKGVVAAGV